MESLLWSPEGQRTLRICIFVLIVSYRSWQCVWFLGVSVLSHLVMTWLLVFDVSRSPVVCSVHVSHGTNQKTHCPLLLGFLTKSQAPGRQCPSVFLLYFKPCVSSMGLCECVQRWMLVSVSFLCLPIMFMTTHVFNTHLFIKRNNLKNVMGEKLGSGDGCF